MPVAVPALNQFYPAVPLKELTSFYSVGAHAFPTTPAAGGNPAQTHRVAVLSYLPRTLMIYDGFQYNNKYILFIEALPQVTSINWTAQLYLNGVQKAAGNFIRIVNTDPFEYNIYFSGSVVDGAGVPLFDRMVITCTVVNGPNTQILQLDHNFAKATNVTSLISATQSSAFAGEPHTFNFMANQLKEYFPTELLQWNGQFVEVLPNENEALLLIVLGVLYQNIMVSPAMNSQLIKSFDWQNFTRTEFVTAINNNTAYTGNFRVGPGMIPLHVLSDAMTDVNAVPDFLNIPNNNTIYTVLSSAPPLTFNGVDPYPPDAAHVQQSKARLMANRSRLIALFHYAMFPRPAIRMVAILIKFLLEASRKNNCNECKNRTATFPYVNLATHNQTPDVIRNMLTHYFQDPYNKIDVFAPEALKVANLSWSPYTYSLVHNVAPRILKAYFARRIAKKISNDFYELNFERTDNLQFRNAAGNWVLENGTQRLDPGNQPIPKPAWDNFLGRETFLVVETWNCQGKTVRCNIGVPANTFNVMVNNNNMQVEFDGNYVYDIDRPFKNYTALNTSANVLPGNNQALVTEYLDVNHASKFIVRIRLRPDTLANFEAWTNSLSNNTRNLTIKTKLTDATVCFFGNNVLQTAASGSFLDANDQYNNQLTYSIINRLVYETHHQLDVFNRLGAGNRIGRIPNRFVQDIDNNNAAMLPSRKAYFIYMDELGHEHFICDCQIHKPKKRRNGRILYSRVAIDPANTAAIVDAFLNNYPQNGNRFYRRGNAAFVLINTAAVPPVQPMDNVANNMGESRHKYFGSHDNQTVFPANRRDEYDEIVVRGVNEENAIVSFEINPDDPNELRVEIVRMPDELDYAFTVGTANKRILYTFTNTERRFANPGCFAAFVGIMAHLSYNNMQSTGMCFDDATSYPSISHPNGDSIDTIHRATPAERLATVAQFRAWGFTRIISGTLYAADGAHIHQANHNSHLHSGDFDIPNNVTDIIP